MHFLILNQKFINGSKTVAESYHLIQNKYFEVINPEKAIINSLDALFQTLDPHSKFMDNKSFKEILESTQGEFCGIGVVIDNTKQNKDECLNLLTLFLMAQLTELEYMPVIKLFK